MSAHFKAGMESTRNWLPYMGRPYFTPRKRSKMNDFTPRSATSLHTFTREQIPTPPTPPIQCCQRSKHLPVATPLTPQAMLGGANAAKTLRSDRTCNPRCGRLPAAFRSIQGSISATTNIAWGVGGVLQRGNCDTTNIEWGVGGVPQRGD